MLRTSKARYHHVMTINDETSVILSGAGQMAWVADRAAWEASYQQWSAHMKRIHDLTRDLAEIDPQQPPTTSAEWVRMASQAKALSDLALMMREEVVRVLVTSFGYSARTAGEEIGVSSATAARWTRDISRQSRP